jgi:adenylosuccinate synthase
MTHLDVYDTLDEIEACVAYNINGKQTEDFPASVPAMNAAKPVLKKFKGWKTPLGGVRRWEDLPQAAKDYIGFIEEYTGTKVGIVGVGYERNATIVRTKVW